MAQRPETPLTDFLIEIVHDLRKLALFTGTEEEREELLRQYPGLGEDHLDALRSGNLSMIQQAVATEHGSADAPAVAYWVTFPLKRPIN
jgi:hypothetical protein